MAEVHGVAGEWARARGSAWGFWPAYLGMFAAGFAVALLVTGWSQTGIVLLALAGGWLWWSYLHGVRYVERFYIGARGEEKVAGVLAQLPAGYHVFNDFVVGNYHVDHVVVGPAGVFAVETKFWRGKVTIEDGSILVNGQLPSHSPLKQVLKEAQLVKGALAKLGWQGEVTPMLVFASDSFDARLAELSKAVVINSAELRPSFAAVRERLSASEVERLANLMQS